MTFTGTPRPEYGVDCLLCAIFARQRNSGIGNQKYSGIETKNMRGAAVLIAVLNSGIENIKYEGLKRYLFERRHEGLLVVVPAPHDQL